MLVILSLMYLICAELLHTMQRSMQRHYGEKMPLKAKRHEIQRLLLPSSAK
jgi:hypothetical protein